MPGLQFKFMRRRSLLRNILEYCVAIVALELTAASGLNGQLVSDLVYAWRRPCSVPDEAAFKPASDMSAPKRQAHGLADG